MPKTPRLGDTLVASGVITEEQLQKALNDQKRTGMKLGEVLIQSKLITESKLIETLATQLKLQIYSLSRYRPMPEALRMISQNVKRLNVVPWR